MDDTLAKRNMLALKKKSFDIKFDLDGSNYQAIENIGTGAYGVVCSALNKLTKEKVAIKKIPNIFEQTVIAKRTYREIRILKHFRHDNVVAIQEILKPKESPADFKDIYIVLDLMESDLHRIIHSKQELTDEHVRYFLYQMLRGLKYIHSANVIHRDLKPSNLLVNENCDLKIGDFGMARGVSSEGSENNMNMTQYVATRWYRAPELLLVPTGYTGAVDMWSIGCIFAEMLGRKQLFPGRDYITQLKLIFGILGTPPPKFQQKFHSGMLRRFIGGWGQRDPIPLIKLFPKAPKKAIDLLGKMLAVDPANRIAVTEALRHPYLSKYHDPDDEPICIPVFNFDFEKQMEKDLCALELRDIILKEIMDYHKSKPQLRRMQFDLRPVPQSELEQSSFRKCSNMTSPNDKQASDLLAFLNNKQQNPVKKDSNNLQQNQQADKTGVNLILVPSAVDVNNKTVSDEDMPSAKTIDLTADNSGLLLPQNEMFPKPTRLPMSVQASATKMSQLSVSADGSQSDVEMPSARSSAEPNSVNKKDPVLPPQTEPAETENKVLDTKALVKLALIRRQQNAEQVNERPRPITAQQRQREREEKKRKKVVKAMERKKKEKKKDNTKKGVNLTDEDKNLLERWKFMQHQGNPAPAACPPVNQLSCTSQVQQPPVHTVPQQVAVDHQTQLTSNLTNFSFPTILNSTSASDTNGSVSNMTNQVNITGVMTDLEPPSDLGLVGSDAAVPIVPIQDKQQIPDTLESAAIAVPAVFSPTDFFQAETPPQENYDYHIGAVHRDPNAVLPDDLSLLSEVLNSHPEATCTTTGRDVSNSSSDSVWDSSLTSSAVNRLPTYAEAMAYRDVLRDGSVSDATVPSHDDTLQKRIIPSQTEELASTSDQQLNSGDLETAAQQLHQYFEMDRLQHDQDNLESLPQNVSLPSMVSGSETAPDWLRAITGISKQMTRSHVDDLTLAKTPKGTGGGYGVGLDLDAMLRDSMANSQTETGLESAPLSASLLADWMEISGDMDPKDLDALHQELDMTSPSLYNTVF